MTRVVLALALVGCGSCTDDGNLKKDPVGESCTAIPAPEMGDATYYDATGGGNCSFPETPNDLDVAAMNAPDYANAAWCGACVEVTGPKGVVTVRVVDQCPGCKKGDLDLSMSAFAKISEVSAGRVKVTWHEVACNVTGPIAFQHKDGTSEFYTAIQVRNHRYPIASLEAKDTAGAYHAIPRVDYNYFIPTDALGAGPYALRTTDTRGQILEDTIPFAAEAVEQGAAQFPACP